MFTRVAAALLAALLMRPAAQVDPNGSKPTVRIDVNLIQIDAIVTDSKGKPSADLKAADFQVSADGRPQVISDCIYVRPQRATSAHSPTPQTAGLPSKSSAPLPGDIRQTVALVVDDLGLAAESVPPVRDALKKFVSEQLQPGDLAALFRTSALSAWPPFTADLRMLNAAVSGIAFKSTGRNGGSSIAPVRGPHGVFTEREPQQRQAMSTIQTLKSLQNVVAALAEMPGRRSMVLLSQNLQVLFSGNRPDPLTLSAYQHVIDAANRASVAIYTIDPRGEVNNVATAADEFHRMRPEQIGVIQLQRGRAIDKSRDGLAILSEQTGGLFFQNTNDLAGALNKAMDDSAGYYLIGFHPDAMLLQDIDAKPRFHSIKVRVNRPGLHVRSREGFFDLGAQPVPTTASTEAERMARALRSPFARDDVHVRLTSLFSGDPSGEYVINSLLRVEPKDLQFVEDSAHAHLAAIYVRELVLNADGDTVGSADATLPLRIEARDFEKTLAQGIIYSVGHKVKRPGSYQVRVAVGTGTPGKLGTAGEVVEIPNIAGGDFALSSLLLQGQTATSAIAPPGDAISRIFIANPEESAAVRIFKSGTTIGYGCLIFNAPSAGHRGIETETRIYHDGLEIYAARPEAFKIDNQADPNRLTGRWSLRLGEKLKPGNYVLRLTATNGLSKKKQRTAVQTVDFTVR